MKTPHKHAELIKAWAEGAEIEYQDPHSNNWYGTYTPSWGVETEYRIKPEKKWYRVAEFRNKTEGTEWLVMTSAPEDEKKFEDRVNFVRWISSRIYYE